MPESDEISKMREDLETTETWRNYSRHIVAELLEACSVCGSVREKRVFVRCLRCEDVYYCRNGECGPRHLLEFHPGAVVRIL